MKPRKPKKPRYIPPAFAEPAKALRNVILELSDLQPYLGLPQGQNLNLDPYRASEALSLVNAINLKQKALSYARQYLSPTVLDDLEPALEADLKELKTKFKELLNER